MCTVKAGGRPVLFAAIAASLSYFAIPVKAEPENNSNETPSAHTSPSGTTTFYGYGASASPVNAASAPAAAPAAVAATVSEPVLEAAVRKLGDKAFASKANAEDRGALAAFYQTRIAPLWLTDGALNSRATAVITEIKKADDWGLQASAFDTPDVTAGSSPDVQGEAEARLSLAVLKYARHARGGRIEPLSISNIWDMKPTLKDPKAVLAEIADNAAPEAYLTALHPKHAGFHNLRQALLKARGPQEPEKFDEALKIKLPAEGTIKPSVEHADISLLRKRLKLAANSASNETLYDARLEAAVRTFQEDNGIKANGILNAKTRSALNREGEPKKSDPSRGVDRIVINMERWRWLPEDLGSLYVMNNIPEFMGRVKKGEQTLWEEKIIVGLPTWPTPILTSSMQFVIFNPEWGVPDGIKVKELLPRLKRASGNSGGGFFDQLFGGGSSSGGARVLAAYGLKPSINGRPVDANSVDWNRVDIRSFSFVQPSGGQNPLGTVKFRFPNRHDVYMHDTTQRGLFAQSRRALSHGCIRVENPRKLAEVLLGEDKGWSSQKVGSMFSSGGGSNEVTLTKEVPVYLTYFTARADSDGKVKTFGDLYGHDSRVMQALAGRAVKYDAPDHSNDEVADATGSYVPAAGPSSKRNGNKKASQQAARRPQNETAGDILSNALSGLLSN